jgi:hypothetical protein
MLQHTGKLSVQLQEPGTNSTQPTDELGRALVRLMARHQPRLTTSETEKP